MPIATSGCHKLLKKTDKQIEFLLAWMKIVLGTQFLHRKQE